MPSGLLMDCDEAVARWFFASFKSKNYSYDRAIGVVDDKGSLIGAILFQNWNGPNVELSYFGRNTLTLGIIRCIARYALATFDLARLTVITSKRNRQFMKALQRIGFKVEGAQRCYYGKRDSNRNTGVRFVAFREDIEKIAKITGTQSQCS
jgi:RimJ/RimL family protein N-acetyltransferase